MNGDMCSLLHNGVSGTHKMLCNYISSVFFQLDRHMRRLEHDLNRFTIELEADTAGITEILEQSKSFATSGYNCVFVQLSCVSMNVCCSAWDTTDTEHKHINVLPTGILLIQNISI